MNRRSFFKAVSATPLAVVKLPEGDIPKRKGTEYVYEKQIIDTKSKIVAMTQFEDKIVIATEYDGIYFIDRRLV